MKNKKRLKFEFADFLNALGKGDRLSYLEANPHGYKGVHKVHKSAKAYNRKSQNWKKEL